MKLYRNAIILTVILAVLAGTYVIFKNKKGEPEDIDTGEGESEIISIFDLDSTEMKQITLENKEGKFVFVRETIKEKNQEGKEVEKKVWKALSPDNLKVDTSTVNSISINFANLKAEKLIEENVQDLKKYGLDSPIRITAKTEDGTEKALEVGNKTPTKGAYYVREKDSSKIYTIGSYEGDKFSVGKKDLKDKNIYAYNVEDIISLSMERDGKLIFRSKKFDENQWSIDYPIQANANLNSIGPMLQSVSTISAVEYIDENPSSVADYGLENPKYVMEFETGSGKTKLLFGKEKEKGKNIYAMLDGGQDVFTISLGAFSHLDKPFKEIIESFAYIVSIWDVSAIDVNIDGQTINCKIEASNYDEDEEKEDKFTVNGKDATVEDEDGNQPFRKFYQALIGITLSEVEIDAQPQGNAEVTFTYTLKKEPYNMKVEFIPKDNLYYYVVKNDAYSGFVVEKAKFDEVRTTYKNLMDIMDKAK